MRWWAHPVRIVFGIAIWLVGIQVFFEVEPGSIPPAQFMVGATLLSIGDAIAFPCFVEIAERLFGEKKP